MSTTVSLDAAIVALQKLFFSFSGLELAASKAVTLIETNAEEAFLASIARVCHEANRGYCHAIGDDSQVSWEEAPYWQRSSAIAGVMFIRDNPDAPASASHESWLEVKEADGWTYGPVKDLALKQHPCCVPYDELPTTQKAKDYIFGAIARTLLAGGTP